MRIGIANNLNEKFEWRCYKRYCKNIKCISYLNPIFSNFHIDLSILLKLFLQAFPCQTNTQIICQQFKLNEHQIALGRKRWAKMVLENYYQQCQKIILGKNGEVVKIDESHFKQKFHKGRVLKRHQWVLGMTERGAGFTRTILLPVEKRDSSTLLPIIESFVSKNCIMICTDEWRAYIKLNTLGYAHKRVNHSKNFVAPSLLQQDPNQKNYSLYLGHAIHTQTIENAWKNIKQRLQLCKGKRVNYLSDIFASLFYLSYHETIEQNSLAVLQNYLKQFHIQESVMEEEEEQNQNSKTNRENQQDQDKDDEVQNELDYSQQEPENGTDDDDNNEDDNIIIKKFKNTLKK